MILEQHMDVLILLFCLANYILFGLSDLLNDHYIKTIFTYNDSAYGFKNSKVNNYCFIKKKAKKNKNRLNKKRLKQIKKNEKKYLRQQKKLIKQQKLRAKKDLQQEKKCSMLELDLNHIKNELSTGVSFKKQKNLLHRQKKLELRKKFECVN